MGLLGRPFFFFPYAKEYSLAFLPLYSLAIPLPLLLATPLS